MTDETELLVNEQIDLCTTKDTNDDDNESKEPIEYKFDDDLPIPSQSYSGDVESKTINEWHIGTGDELQVKQLLKPSLCWFAMNRYPPNQPTKRKEFCTHTHDGKTIHDDEPIRKLFVQVHVHRIVDVDVVNETFRAELAIKFQWLALYSEYRAFLDMDKRFGDPEEILRDFPEPKFDNAIEEHLDGGLWKYYTKDCGFRRYNMFGRCLEGCNRIVNPDVDKYEDLAIYIEAQKEFDITFRETLELQSFPFDCQDLSIVMGDEHDGVWKYLADIEMEHPPDLTSWCRPSDFALVDPTTSLIPEWNVENVMVELAGVSTDRGIHRIVRTNIKLSRRWKPVVINALFVVFLLSTLSITVFTIDYTDTASRLGVTLTLILTAVLFDKQSAPQAYLTFMDRYFNATYFYLTILTFLTSFVGSYAEVMDENIDNYMFVVFATIYVIYNAVFVAYAIRLRLKERKKLTMTWKEIEEYNAKTQLQRPRVVVSSKEREKVDHGFVYCGEKR
eukprot:350351_1